MSSSNLPTKPLVILYVEDNVYVRASVIEILASPMRQFVCVGHRKGALEALCGGPIDLLLTDVNLPDGSGLDLVREAVQRNPSMPVIVCSGDDLTLETTLLGPNVHALRKPFDFDELEGLVKQLAVQRP